jgi:hypothetical protein
MRKWKFVVRSLTNLVCHHDSDSTFVEKEMNKDAGTFFF